MNISAVSNNMTDSLAIMATGSKNQQVQQAVQVSVLKKTMDQQKTAGEAIVKMIENTPAAGEPGSLVDIKA